MGMARERFVHAVDVARHEGGFARGAFGALRLALALACPSVSACADNQSSIFIRQVNLPVPTDSCIVSADPENLTIGAGTLDLAFRNQYSASLLVGNQLTARGSQQSLRTETSRVQLEGSEVTGVDSASGSVVFGPVTVPGSGFMDPASGTDPGWGLIDSVLFSPSTSYKAALEAATAGTVWTVTSHVKVFGHTLGGASVESGEFSFPISLCWGCLVSFPTDAVNTSYPQPNCLEPVASGTTLSTPCIVGQDDTVDCRVCKEFNPGASFCDP